MKIDLYTRCWNDVRMLPFFFDHYAHLVERIVVYDDGSTDGSLGVLGRHPKVELRPRPPYADPGSHVASSQALMNAMWKESRGRADWVIVTDVDEHLHHRDGLASYLELCAAQGVTMIPALGFQMLSETFPIRRPGLKLCDQVQRGAPWGQMSKLSIFSPDHIQETDYSAGRHSARPTGRVISPPRDELLLLHYKYLGRAETQRRHEACRERLRAGDLERQWGHKYLWSTEELDRDWAEIAGRLVDVSDPTQQFHEVHAEPRWWAELERARAW